MKNHGVQAGNALSRQVDQEATVARLSLIFGSYKLKNCQIRPLSVNTFTKSLTIQDACEVEKEENETPQAQAP